MKYLFFLGILLATASCKVGPDYEPPLTPMPEIYSEEPVDKTFLPEEEDLVKWWSRFDDPVLDALLEEAVSNNFDYHIALEKVYQARMQLYIQFTQMLPEIDASSQASRFRTSQSFRSNTSTLSPFQNFFQCGFDAIWQIDLFGKLRRSTQAAYDTWEASNELAEQVKITILSEVANTYAEIGALQKKVDIALQVISLDQDLFHMAKVRFDAGLANEQEMEAARATLEGDFAQLKLQESLLRQTIYSLGILLGRAPETLLADFQTLRPIPEAQGKVPTGLPSELLRRRPDIRAAERQLAAATEQIGVAVAALFPELSLTGSSSSFAANPLQGANIGWTSDRLNKLFNPASLVWGIGGLVIFPLLDFGKRNGAIDVQVSLQQQNYLEYQKTVIAALQEVEQALTAYFHEEERLRSLKNEEASSRRSLNLSQDLFEAGLASYSDLLVARGVWLASLNSLVDSQEALATDLIALYKALGGEW